MRSIQLNVPDVEIQIDCNGEKVSKNKPSKE